MATAGNSAFKRPKIKVVSVGWVIFGDPSAGRVSGETTITRGELRLSVEGIDP